VLGSFQYSIQAIWTATQHKLPIVFVVMRNGEAALGAAGPTVIVVPTKPHVAHFG
jgi:hypothetical protein